MSDHIERAWRSYRDEAIPPGAPEVQRIETRRAFYTGAVSLLGILHGGVSDGDDVTPDDMQLMADLQNELRSFVDRLGA